MRYVIGITTVLMASAMALSPASTRGEVVDRVVAFIDDTAITLSELEQSYREALKLAPDVTIQEVLETIINSHLLLREARRLRFRGLDEQEILNHYIDMKIKAFITISEDEVLGFYNENRASIGGVAYDEVRDEIEKYLREKEINQRLRQHIRELREKVYIKVMLD
jgi:hypothetical protein